ncbi:ATP-grasp domain-containing protein [Pseudoalteromonas byunsanensis]|uniref:ATP-grasp domain-containing protein n=1 Tax=Pseudoalteromonas byunsanensis TaxID=327939 RepID=A0A1S1N5V0_9GAMM|nr:hypothetical protein [Pseudoalteromonas byunsanensis]OHU96612.1 hypothetical protein BIW53_04590 [Pseudoalteromonas byunsanensis]
MSKALTIRGIPDNCLIKFIGKENFAISGSSNISDHLILEDMSNDTCLLDPLKGGRANINTNNLSVVINEIADPDSHALTLLKSMKLCDTIGKPVINPPRHILNTDREMIYKTLSKIKGLHIPKTVKLNPKSPHDIVSCIYNNKLNYPMLIREAGSHGGESLTLLENAQQVERLYHLALDGRKYYLTEYAEYKDDDGQYAKHRLAVVGGKVFLRHVIVSNSWMIHSNSRKHSFISKEKALQTAFEEEKKFHIQKIVSKIYRELKLDYFGIDCAINDKSEMLIFEVNANMNILINGHNHADEYIAPIKFALSNLIKEKSQRV